MSFMTVLSLRNLGFGYYHGSSMRSPMLEPMPTADTLQVTLSLDAALDFPGSKHIDTQM